MAIAACAAAGTVLLLSGFVVAVLVAADWGRLTARLVTAGMTAITAGLAFEAAAFGCAGMAVPCAVSAVLAGPAAGVLLLAAALDRAVTRRAAGSQR